MAINILTQLFQVVFGNADHQLFVSSCIQKIVYQIFIAYGNIFHTLRSESIIMSRHSFSRVNVPKRQALSTSKLRISRRPYQKYTQINFVHTFYLQSLVSNVLSPTRNVKYFPLWLEAIHIFRSEIHCDANFAD